MDSDAEDNQPDPGERLRAAGLRSTPQRRAILAAFRGGSAEHLSADEIYARAALTSPDLGRGTVYATLAEFTESGLLAALGSPEPVRYEINVSHHAHFRCLLCLRIYDVTAPALSSAVFEDAGHRVDRIDLRAEGVCVHCRGYSDGLEAGVAEITTKGITAADGPRTTEDAPLSAVEFDSPIGPLLVVASARGVTRVAFPEHGDLAALRRLLGADAGPDAAAHLARAREELSGYLGGRTESPRCEIDWDRVGSVMDLTATNVIAHGEQRSYHLLETQRSPRGLGELYGANPVPLLIPCHRVMLGALLPDSFVGGSERRAWLLEHEQRLSHG